MKTPELEKPDQLSEIAEELKMCPVVFVGDTARQAMEGLLIAGNQKALIAYIGEESEVSELISKIKEEHPGIAELAEFVFCDPYDPIEIVSFASSECFIPIKASDFEPVQWEPEGRRGYFPTYIDNFFPLKIEDLYKKMKKSILNSKPIFHRKQFMCLKTFSNFRFGT